MIADVPRVTQICQQSRRNAKVDEQPGNAKALATTVVVTCNPNDRSQTLNALLKINGTNSQRRCKPTSIQAGHSDVQRKMFGAPCVMKLTPAGRVNERRCKWRCTLRGMAVGLVQLVQRSTTQQRADAERPPFVQQRRRQNMLRAGPYRCLHQTFHL